MPGRSDSTPAPMASRRTSTRSHASATPIGSGGTRARCGQRASASPTRSPGLTPNASAAGETSPTSCSRPGSGASAAGARSSAARPPAATTSGKRGGMTATTVTGGHMFAFRPPQTQVCPAVNVGNHMRAALATAVAVLALGASSASAATSPNVRPIARLPELTTAISINFIGDTMFVSTVHGLYSYDVSNPAAPRRLGVAPQYIWENEDMDVDPVRKRVFISRDPRGFTSPATSGSTFPYGALEIYDASDPANLRLLNAVLLDAGHTTSCVNRCDFVWTAGPTASSTTQPGDWGGRPV